MAVDYAVIYQSSQLADGVVTTSKLAANAVTAAKVAADVATQAELDAAAATAAAAAATVASNLATHDGQDVGDAHGSVTHNEVAAANKDGVAATPSMRTLGTGAQQAAAGNDSRFVTNAVAGTAANKKVAGGIHNGSTDASGNITIATGLASVEGFSATVDGNSPIGHGTIATYVSKAGGNVTIRLTTHSGVAHASVGPGNIYWTAVGT